MVLNTGGLNDIYVVEVTTKETKLKTAPHDIHGRTTTDNETPFLCVSL